MFRTFKDISSDMSGNGPDSFLIWREEDLFPILNHPMRMDFMGLFIPLDGKMEDEINLQPACLDKHHIQVFTHSYIVRILHRSDDFRCVGLLFSREYWEKVMFETHSSNSLVRLFPCIEVTDDQRNHLLEYYRLICAGAGREEYEYSKEITGHLITGLFYELGMIYKMQIQRISAGGSRQELLMSRFMELLYKNYREHRDVAFYADELSLTQRYFTTAIRKTSGASAMKWIERYVVLEAQLMLRDTSLDIKEIAAELNFGDPSHFSKYFKRVTGLSPEEYRRK